MGGAWTLWGWLWPALMVLGLALGGYVAIRKGRGASPGRLTGGNVTAPAASGPSSTRQILDERFARGEIDEDEYRRRRAELS